jgi:aldose 1-epimerase
MITASILALFAIASPLPAPVGTPSVSVEDWGTFEGKTAHLWTLVNDKGMKMKVTDYGTIITELWVPDSRGSMVDVVLGRPTLQDYVDRTQYFGCTAGRCANRIAKGTFSIDGKEYKVSCNNGANSLHGGARGFDKRMWTGKAEVKNGEPTITFTYVSPDGEEGFPGTCEARVTYTLTALNELAVEMQAVSDKPTCVNLAHHSYWNLAGQGQGSILDHELMLAADDYTPVDASLITTGEIKSVLGTPLDFRQPKPIGRDIGQLPATKDDPGGYDHNFVVRGEPGRMRNAAAVRCRRTGIAMIIQSDQPGIQFYSGNFLDGIPGKAGTTYDKHGGLCLETQAFPDSINKQGKEGWPSVILRPGGFYTHSMRHAFKTMPVEALEENMPGAPRH